MRTKRVLAILLTAVMAMGLLAGCGGGNSSSETTTAAATTAAAAATTAAAAETTAAAAETTAAAAEETTAASVDASQYEVTEPVEIEFVFAAGVLEDYFNQMVDGFNASQDKITATARYAGGSYDKVREQVTAAQAAGTGVPALVTMNFPSVSPFALSGAAENLSGYLQAFDIDTSDFLDGYMDAVTYDGDPYGLPMGPSSQVYYYNKDVIDSLGLTFPTTWDEFKTYCQEVYEKTGKPAMIYKSDQNTYYNMILNFGGAMIEEDGTCGYDNEQVINRMKELRELVKAGYIEWTVEGGKTGFENRFLNGDVLGLGTSSGDYRSMKTDTFNVGVAWNYKDVSSYSTIGGMVLLIPSAAPQDQKNAAFQLMLYMTTPEQNEKWSVVSSYALTHYSSIDKGTGEGTPIAEISKSLPGIEVLYEHSDDIISKEKTLHYDSVMKVVQSSIDQIMSDMSADFDSVWQGMVEECDYILAGN